MTLTYRALCSLPDDEQLRDERIAIICEGEGCGEETAVEIMEKAQIPLFKT